MCSAEEQGKENLVGHREKFATAPSSSSDVIPSLETTKSSWNDPAATAQSGISVPGQGDGRDHLIGLLYLSLL